MNNEKKHKTQLLITKIQQQTGNNKNESHKHNTQPQNKNHMNKTQQ